MSFEVEGFQSISSRPTLSFPRLEKIDVAKSIFEGLREKREDEYKSLSEAGVVIGDFNFDSTKETHPLRIFAAFRLNENKKHNEKKTTQKRIFARELYETLLPFQPDKVANISVYWGAESYDFLLKIRLKKFEDYEAIWDECLKSFSSVFSGVIVQSDTFLELNRVSLRESDDGAIWKEVENYRQNHRLKWPRSNL
jgi:hypothetical protein